MINASSEPWIGPESIGTEAIGPETEIESVARLHSLENFKLSNALVS